MKITGERYFPRVGNAVFAPFEPFVSYEHWHRYCYALPFVEGKAVLDIASGEGYGSAFLADRAALVYGVDLSEEAVEHARATYVRDNLHYLHGPAESIPIPGEHCFDVIVSFETIEHLDAPNQERFAAEVRRLLKPDGVLLISTPNRDTYNHDDIQGNPYHFHEFRKDEFVAYLHQSFAHVRLLCQHVYPMSYIWNLESSSGRLVEYQVRLDDGRFRPRVDDGKEIGYLIAVCGDQRERIDAADSLLVDLSEVAFRGIPGSDRWQTTSLFIDTGAGFRAEEVIRAQIEYSPGFTQEFNLDPTRPVAGLRWDPIESRLCSVRLKQILWQDDDGLVSRVDLDLVTSNGRRTDEGRFEFLTLDPMIFLPISGRVASILITGQCEVADVTGTMTGMEQAVWMREQELGRQRQDLRLISERLAAQERADEERLSRLSQEVEHKDRLSREVEDKDRLLNDKDRLLKENCERLAALERADLECRSMLSREVEDKDRQLKEKRRQLEDKERQFEDKERQLEDKERQLETNGRILERTIAERDGVEAELARAFGSKSWRFTAPLRAAGRFARRVRRRARTAMAIARRRVGALTSKPRLSARPQR